MVAYEAELTGLPGAYALPRGAIWLAYADAEAVGCIALRPFSTEIAEVKRLYVSPTTRGQGVGRLLMQQLIRGARERGYHAVHLITLPSQEAAVKLYQVLGFEQIAPYAAHHIPGDIYFRLLLA